MGRRFYRPNQKPIASYTETQMLPHILFSINWKGFLAKKNRQRDGDEEVKNREQSLATNAASLLFLMLIYFEYEISLQLSER